MGLFDKSKDQNELKLQIADITVRLANVREQVGSLTKRLSEIDADLSAYQAKSNEYAAYAKKALAAGSEADARVFLNEKYKFDKKVADITPQREQVYETRCKAVELHDKMVDEINKAEARLDMLVARNAVADASIAASKTVNSSKFQNDLSSLEEQSEQRAAMTDAQRYANGEK
ncbi:PspA/IM30 family protein [Ruminococcus sp. NK3A76]|uniref:PspA/IM30 family protein n=1 Tax=Ruminococcus sp. NK3A76 TaxID=877411 RepID=UPI00048A8349|nr:PspA/IM30 family protein [Ruminococcus sp. NK3A76]